jgi:hypothetical protein
MCKTLVLIATTTKQNKGKKTNNKLKSQNNLGRE